jgi:aryl-alcohol dehydrogenase-like predicted oxidoreductase
MEYTHLGGTGMHVSRLGLGIMNFGSQAEEAGSFAILNQIWPGLGREAPEAYAW